MSHIDKPRPPPGDQISGPVDPVAADDMAPSSGMLSSNGGALTLARLMPMFIFVDPAGYVRAAGPTIRQVCEPAPLIGQCFADVFCSTRGGELGRRGLEALWGGTLHLSLKASSETTLRGLVIPARWQADVGALLIDLPGGTEPLADQGAGSLINCSFGIDLAEATRRHALTGADFAHTDLAMELLYLQEAKSAVMRELQALNGRLEEARRAAENQALTDSLTGLSNRRAVEMQLDLLLDQRASQGGRFAILHLDLDHFKQVNDSLGHAAGDQVLMHTATILREQIRRDDIAARVGGDEFLLLLREFDNPDGLAALGRRLIARIEEPVAIGGHIARVSASVGIVVAQPGRLNTADQLLSAVDDALYASKRAGRGRCTVWRDVP